MKIAGIIAEYNPFHTGHAYHIQKTRELTGADYIIVVLSGDFVQRGAPACIPSICAPGWHFSVVRILSSSCRQPMPARAQNSLHRMPSDFLTDSVVWTFFLSEAKAERLNRF
ncbi:hypothetical protein DW961_15380 [Blautia sp. AM46-3MH]|nr:hypothetical protein DW961_15380 [Blautia sp. AM46-3MH]